MFDPNPLVNHMQIILLFFSVVSCSYYLKSSLSSNTLNLILRQQQVGRNLDKGTSSAAVDINLHFTFKSLLRGAVEREDEASIRNYLDILYQNNPEYDHINAPLESESGFSLIHYAVKFNNTRLLDLVVNDYRGDIERKDHYNRTALMLAIDFGHMDCVLFLIRVGVKTNFPIKSFLSLQHYAASNNNVSILLELFRSGHDFTEDPNCGWANLETPLELALKNGALEAAEFLYKHGARVPSKHRLLRICKRGNFKVNEFIKTLI